MTLQIHAEAKKEFFDAVDYYTTASEKVSTNFIDEFEHCVANILEFPTAWPPIPYNCRRCLFRTFKYSLVYRIVNDEIFVLAVMHNSRKPDYWLERIK